MKIKIDEELKFICKKIIDENKNEHQWKLIESCNMFQTEHYCGGYDATERAFCFSYYAENKKEFWFQFSLEEVKEILENKILFLESESTELGNSTEIIKN